MRFFSLTFLWLCSKFSFCKDFLYFILSSVWGGRKQKRRETANRASVSTLFVIAMSCVCEGQQWWFGVFGRFFFGSVVSTCVISPRYSNSPVPLFSFPFLLKQGWDGVAGTAVVLTWHCGTPWPQCGFCGRRGCYRTKVASNIFKASTEFFCFYLCLLCINSGFACKCEGDGEILDADGKKPPCLDILKNPELEGDKFI